MQKINYFLRPRYDNNAEGLHLIELEVRIDGQRKRFSLNQFINAKYWDRVKRELKGGRGLPKSEALRINLLLNSYLDRAAKIVSDARITGEQLTPHLFQQKLFQFHKPLNLIQFTREWMEENPTNCSKESLKTYSSLITLWEETYGSGIGLDDIPGIREKLEKKMLKRNNSLNTRKKYHSKTKTMINRAIEAGYQLKDPYTKPIGIIKGNRNYLTLEELRRVIKIYKSGILDTHLQRTLKHFLFACFTGCRISDMKELRHTNVMGSSLQYIAVKTRKFEKRIEAPLPDVARSLIGHERGPLFEMRCDQITNRNLVDIFRKLKIHKHITFHCARHTFATLYIYLGGEVTNLKEILGHSKIETTMIYVQMARRLTVMQQRLFDEEFGKDMKVITQGKADYMEVA